jgi:hypothetical protein
VILFLLFTNDVTICMELDPGIHIGSTWFVLETGCDRRRPGRRTGEEEARTGAGRTSGVTGESGWARSRSSRCFGLHGP